MVFLKEIFKKVDFEKKQQIWWQKSMKIYPVGKELTDCDPIKIIVLENRL